MSCVAFWVYPRVCGGTSPQSPLWKTETGLSPRVRGNLSNIGLPPGHLRSIPACAGEPDLVAYYPRVCGGTDPGIRRMLRVYHRVCGGTGRRGAEGKSDAGLSPRVRGNQLQQSLLLGGKRSIPACAGEPSRLWPGDAACAIKVYPRVCGGTE